MLHSLPISTWREGDKNSGEMKFKYFFVWYDDWNSAFHIKFLDMRVRLCLFTCRIVGCRKNLPVKNDLKWKIPHHPLFIIIYLESISINSVECVRMWRQILKHFQIRAMIRIRASTICRYCCRRRRAMLLGRNQRLKPLEQIRRVGFLILCVVFRYLPPGAKIVNEFSRGCENPDAFFLFT